MIRAGSSYIYTNTIIVEPTTANLVYKYGTDPGGIQGGPNDDEAAPKPESWLGCSGL